MLSLRLKLYQAVHVCELYNSFERVLVILEKNGELMLQNELLGPVNELLDVVHIGVELKMHLVCRQLIVLRHIKTFVEVELPVASSSFKSCHSTFFLPFKVIVMYIIASQSVLVAYWIIVPN